MNLYTITTNMPGYLSESDAESFEASPETAIAALIDEAEFQLDSDSEYIDEAFYSDQALVESFRNYEGRADLLAQLERNGEASIYLESYANGFGGFVRLALAEEA